MLDMGLHVVSETPVHVEPPPPPPSLGPGQGPEPTWSVSAGGARRTFEQNVHDPCPLLFMTAHGLHFLMVSFASLGPWLCAISCIELGHFWILLGDPVPVFGETHKGEATTASVEWFSWSYAMCPPSPPFPGPAGPAPPPTSHSPPPLLLGPPGSKVGWRSEVLTC